MKHKIAVSQNQYQHLQQLATIINNNGIPRIQRQIALEDYKRTLRIAKTQQKNS